MVLNFMILLSFTKLTFCHKQVQYHGLHQNGSINFIYINLKQMKGYKLDVTPLATYSVQNRSMCAEECLLTKGTCKSINTRPTTNGGLECEILNQDMYNKAGKLKNDSSSTHYIIAVSQSLKKV